MSLTRMIKKIKNERSEVKILVVGPDNAGKTTILHKVFNRDVTRIAPTFGYQIHHFKYNLGECYNLTVLDVGGQSSFRKYWCNYYDKIDGMIFVYDSCENLGSVLERL